MGWLKDAVELAAAAVAVAQRLEARMATWDEQLQGLSAQLSKVSGEIVSRLDALAVAIDSPTPEQQQALDGIRAQAQALDDLVPDEAPQEPETPEAPAEPTP